MDQVTGERVFEQDDVAAVLLSPSGTYATALRLDGVLFIHDLDAGEQVGVVTDERISQLNLSFVPGEDALWLTETLGSLARIDLATATLTDVVTTKRIGIQIRNEWIRIFPMVAHDLLKKLRV